MATPGSFMVPAGRRLSRMDSKTLRSSFTGENNDEMEAVMRNLARKDDKIKYNRRMRMVLAGAVAVMVVMVGAMLGVTLAANEATKESHISRSNTMVGLDGSAVTTAKDTAYVKLAELSRAGTEYLSNLEDVTLSAKGKVHQFHVTGYTLYDSDNLDLYTSTQTVIKVQCGAIRIQWEGDKLEDVDEMHTEAAGAARQLRAMSAAELQAHYEEHASAETRKLAVSNPLKSLAAFFGGMSKSSANSELYGALAPTTGCKKPAAIISFARPTIPKDSKWTVSVPMESEDAKDLPAWRADMLHTWYMSWDQKETGDMPKMRFESAGAKECEIHVEVVSGDKASNFNQQRTDAKCVAAAAEELAHLNADVVDCPPTAALAEAGMTCAAYQTELKKEMIATVAHDNKECKVNKEKPFAAVAAENLQVKILDAKTDGSSVWEIGFWVMEVDGTGTPTGIKSTNMKKFFKVLKVEAFDPFAIDNMWDGCTETKAEPSAKIQKLLMAVVPDAKNDGKRRLGVWSTMAHVLRSAWQGKLAGTNWCGPGDKTHETKGVTSTLDASCRRHDHGHGYQSQPWYLLWMPKAYCRIDNDIVNGANGATKDGSISQADLVGGRNLVNTVFGRGTYFYCTSNVRVSHCNWGCRNCGWRGCNCGCAYSYSTENKDFWHNDKNHYMSHGTNPGYADGCTHNDINRSC